MQPIAPAPDRWQKNARPPAVVHVDDQRETAATKGKERDMSGEITESRTIEALLFDLDGTLVDSLPDLAASLNILVAEEGAAPLSLDEVKGMIGHGIAKLVERASRARGLETAGEALAARVARMMEIYDGHLTVGTRPLPGALEALARAADKGLKLAVVTNKPEAMSRRILSHFGMDAHLGAVVGGDTCATRKPRPEMVVHAAVLLGVATRHCVMIGDSPADVGAAQAAGIPAVVLSGGYHAGDAEAMGADALIDGYAELDAALDGLRAGR
jgi:phosphoglycolate phosphatase